MSGAEPGPKDVPVGAGGIKARLLHPRVTLKDFLAEGREGGAAAVAAAPGNRHEGIDEEPVHDPDELPCAVVRHSEFGRGGADRAGGGDVTEKFGFARAEGVGRGVGEAESRLENGGGAWHRPTSNTRSALVS